MKKFPAVIQPCQAVQTLLALRQLSPEEGPLHSSKPVWLLDQRARKGVRHTVGNKKTLTSLSQGLTSAEVTQLHFKM